MTFIPDDQFLAVVGSLASIFNASGRISWGKLMDHIGFKVNFIKYLLCFKTVTFRNRF